MGEDARRPEDRLLPSRRFLIAWTAAIVLLAAAAWLLLPRWSWYMRSRTARVERGAVTAVEHQGSMDRVTVTCASGPVTLEVERPSSIFAPQAVDEGERVLVRFGADGPSLGPKVRDRTLLAVTALFFIILAVAGGKRALRTALSLVAAFLLLVLVLAPLTLAGWNPLLVGLVLAGVIAAGTIAVVAGLNRAALAALLGTLGGLVLAVAVGLHASWLLALTGLSIDFGPYAHLGTLYWRSPQTRHVDFGGLLVAGVVLSCLGAAMDVAVTVAAAVREIAANRPDVSRREALRAGLSVGRAAVWVTAATFFFVLLGANIEPFLARSLQHDPAEWVRLLGFEEIAVEVVRLVAAGLAMTAVAPLTALCAAVLLARRRAPAIPDSRSQIPDAEPMRPGPPSSQSAIGNRQSAVPFLWRLAVPGAFAAVLVLGLVLLDRLALRSIPAPLDASEQAGFASEQALGRVLAVRPPAVDEGSERPDLRDEPVRWQLIACQVLSGEHAGKVVLVNQMVHPNPEYVIVVREGDYATLELASRGDVVTSSALRKPALRHRALLAMVGVLFLALLAFGGWRSARNTLGVVGIVALLLAVVFPLLRSGVPPLAVMAGFSATVVGGVLLLFYGWDRKALAALAGTVGALVLVVAVTAAASHGLKLTGLDSPGSRYLVELWQHPPRLRFDYRELLLAGLLVAVLGVAIDTSVSIAAGIEELYRTHPAIGRRAAFASGLAIGRDVMGVCATTFVFASVGVRIPVLLCPAAAGLAPAELVNAEAGCVEIVRLLAGGIGLLATAPLTTLAAVALFSRRGTEAAASRQVPRSAFTAMAAAFVGAAAALALFVLETPPHERHPSPRFASLEGDGFKAVEDEANALLEQFDYPRAILLLWRAQDRGIGGLRPCFVLPDLYRDYLAYVHYYEREGLPERVQRQWARTTAEAASRAWMVHRIAEYQAAVAKAPDSIHARQGLGRLLCQADRPDEAIPHFLAALDRDPDNVELLCDLATAYTRTGQPERADPLAERLRRLAPQHPRVQELLERLKPALSPR